MANFSRTYIENLCSDGDQCDDIGYEAGCYATPGWHSFDDLPGLNLAVVRAGGTISHVTWLDKDNNPIGQGLHYCGLQRAHRCTFIFDPGPRAFMNNQLGVQVELTGRRATLPDIFPPLDPAPKTPKVELVRAESKFEQRMRVLREEGMLPPASTFYWAAFLALEIIAAVVTS